METVAPGDAVTMLWRPRCGQCHYCIIGQPVMCELGRVQATTNGLPDDRLDTGTDDRAVPPDSSSTPRWTWWSRSSGSRSSC